MSETAEEPAKPEPAQPERTTAIDPPTTIVTFTKQWASYYAGEKAAFAPDAAARLIEEGVAEGGDPPDPPDPEGEITPHEDATS